MPKKMGELWLSRADPAAKIVVVFFVHALRFCLETSLGGVSFLNRRAHRSGQDQAPSVAGVSSSIQVEAFSLFGDNNIAVAPSISGSVSKTAVARSEGVDTPPHKKQTHTRETPKTQPVKGKKTMTNQRKPISTSSTFRKRAAEMCLVCALALSGPTTVQSYVL
jgi:hypothetical protein